MKMMNTFNTVVLDITVAIIDFLYKGGIINVFGY